MTAARPSNPVTGRVNFSTAPGTGASRITTLKDGHLLTVIGETLDWYKAVDSVTGMTGYVMKAHVARV
ncbi:MAG: SH3 domain-containing protein [Clostridia bacterium]|nr:SH3 domain-containing protein [Clostridia bacterium]